MKKLIVATIVGLTAIGSTLVLPTEVDARPYHRGGGVRAGVYLGTGIVAGALLAAPYAYSRPYRPYYYGGYPYPYYGYAPAYYPPVVVQEQPTVYVEQQAFSAPPPSSAPQAQAQQQFWYFCQDSQTYYPHVQTCASPWQRVTPHAAQ